MNIKIFKKMIVWLLVNLMVLQALPTVVAEEIAAPVVEEQAQTVESAVTEAEQFVESSTEAPAEPELAPATEPAVTEAEQKAPPQYNQLMRQVDTTLELSEPGKSFSNTVLQFFPTEIKDEKYQISKENVGTELQTFINSEKIKLKDSAIDDEKKETYFNQLEKQLAIVKGEIPAESQEAEEIKIPEKPSSFALEKKEIKIEQVENLIFKKNIDPGLIEETFKKLQLIQVAEAYMDEYMPILADLQADDGEVIINQEIRDLAVELEGNPVKIMNFVRNNIDYESYYGSKKNSVGCLRERVCNDVDAASLTIALMRTAGIPARYKKSLVLVDVQQLKELLGVEETQTVFQALQMPIFTVDGVMEFNAMTKLAIEWVHPEIFYSYDERSGNFSAPAHEVFADLEAMRAYLRGFKNVQWLPVEPMMKGYTRTNNEIAQDTAGFDTEDFWQRYLQYQGELSPIGKYQEELGIDPDNVAIQSGKQLVPEEFDFLPYTLPYLVAQGEAAGNDIMVENFSTLPDRYRHQVIISLLNADTQQAVFSHTFNFSEVNNQPIDLYYQGFTDIDETTIVEHGGIHATPATLVDIKPFLIVDGEQYEGDQPLEIGQSLVLQFEYPDLAKVDQKFSVAGNSEGIFMYFSKLQENQLLDDEADPDRNSKILLEGNAMMAREYLRKVEENTEVVEKYLDYNYDLAVNRAVVTQNRITNKLDDVATTFDFKGLSIDASLYGNGYSNRGALETHGDDFSLLWLLHASYYEAQVFEDLTGLNAISTVTGLQYAYGNPDQYDVITVTQNNSGIIDDLDFSANTKANMHDDIAAGATIITPNKPVQKENWRGIVYISRDPDGVDKYAIGEQAQGNGGETTDPSVVEQITDDEELQDELEEDIENGDLESFRIESGDVMFRFKDNSDGKPIDCSLSVGKYTELLAEADNDHDGNRSWKLKYGWPCSKGTKEYGSITSTYILATDGAKFFAGTPNVALGFIGYTYWKKDSEIEDILNEKIGDEIDQGTFHFDTATGTYMLEGDNGKKYVYYHPTPDADQSHIVDGEALIKLKEYVDILGFPISEKTLQDQSVANVRAGNYQQFRGGQIYEMASLYMPYYAFNTYYVPGKIAEFYNSNEYCRANDLCGSAGAFGFPLNDPESSTESLTQEFEQATLVMNNNSKEIVITDPSESTVKFQNKLFAEKLLKEVEAGETTDVEAFASISDHLASVAESDNEFADYFSALLLGTDSMVLSSIGDFINGEQDYHNSENYPYQVVGWSDTGFKFKYNDSHYCMSARDLKSIEGLENIDTTYNFHCLSNQLYHSMGGFIGAYWWGSAAAKDGNWMHERGSNPLGFNGASEEDRSLTGKMIDFGDELDDQSYYRSEMGERILDELAQNDYGSSKISRANLLEKEQYRMKFRVFEYEQNGNKNDMWSYSDDMKGYKCNNGPTLYYQDYTSIYFNNIPLNYWRLVATSDNEKLIFLPQTLDVQGVCNNLSDLRGSKGYSLTLKFTDPDYYGDGNTCVFMLDRLRNKNQNLSGKPDLSDCL